MDEVEATGSFETCAEIEMELEEVERVIEAAQERFWEIKDEFEECVDLEEGEELDPERLQAVEDQLSALASCVCEAW